MDLLSESRIETRDNAFARLRGNVLGPGGLRISGSTLIIRNESGNTYEGHTTLESGVLVIESPGALGSSSGFETDGTTLMPGTTLEFSRDGAATNEWIKLSDASIVYLENSNGKLDSQLFLQGQNFVQSDSEQGLATSGFWTGPGGMTYGDALRPVTLRHAADYQGPTIVSKSRVIAGEPSVFGSPATGTTLDQSRITLQDHEENHEPFVVGPESTITADINRLSGKITLAGGTLDIERGRPVFSITEPIQVNGYGLIDGDGASRTVVEQGIQGNGSLRVDLRNPLEVHGEIDSDVELIVQSPVELHHPQTFSQRIMLDGGRLHAAVDTTIHNLQTNGFIAELSSATDARITVREFDPGDSKINANLVYDRPIVVDRSFGPTFENLGQDYSSDIIVERGTLAVSGNGGLGNDSGETIIAEGSSATILILPEVEIGETIRLNNGRGRGYFGSLIATSTRDRSQPATLTGTLDLGDRGAFIGTNGESWNDLRLAGPIVGGDLIQLRGEITIVSDKSAYTGQTIVGGQVRLADGGRLKSTSEIQLSHRYASLTLDNDAVRNNDRIDDSIPITMNNGHIVLQTPDHNTRTTERLGPITVQRGHAAILASGGDSAFVLDSLIREPGTTVEFGRIDAGRMKISNPPEVSNGTLGGWARSGNTFVTMRGDTVVNVEPARKPISDATNGQHIWWRDDDRLRTNKTIGSFIALGRSNIDLGGNSLTVNSGGILADGIHIFNGALRSGSDELYLHGNSRITASIVDRGENALNLVVSGGVDLAGVNTYSGTTTVNGGGGLHISSAESLPAKSDVFLHGGELTLEEDFEFGVISIRDGGSIRVRDTSRTFQANEILAESGSIGRGLSGETPVLKTGFGTLNLYGPMPSYGGTITIEEGVVATHDRNATGTGTVQVNQDGVFAAGPNEVSNIVLNGGSLWVNGKSTSVRNIHVQVDSNLVGRNFDVGPNAGADMQITGEITGAGNLKFLARSGSVLSLLRPSPNYTGTIEVSGGELVLDHPNAIGQNNRVIVSDDASLIIRQPSATTGIIELHGSMFGAHLRSHESGHFVGKLSVFDTVNIYRSTMELSGITRFANDSKLLLTEHSDVKISGSIAVGQGVAIEIDEFDEDYDPGKISLSGVLSPTTNLASLDLIGTPENLSLDLNEILLEENTSLEITRNGSPVELGIGTDTARLTGSGTMHQSISLQSQGRIEPGLGIGQITIDGDLRLAGGAMDWQIRSAMDPTAHDQIRVTGSVTTETNSPVAALVNIVPIDHEGNVAELDGFDPLSRYLWTVGNANDWKDVDLSRISIGRSHLDSFYPLARHGSFSLRVDDSELLLEFAGKSDLGDFDQDGFLNGNDINLLSVAIMKNQFDPLFDLNLDRIVDGRDLAVWVEDLRNTVFGDANLDGTFNSADLVDVFQSGEYEDEHIGNSTWETGDWNADREFTSRDFVVAFQGGGYSFAAESSQVPEPICPVGTLLYLLLLSTSQVRCKKLAS